ncbi:MAG: tryptophan synthase subunit alpha [Gammaproteobacteria bacterium]|nr:tryptophan synthase subunit alpha [Gammaproteobacteria bacterium]
MSRIAECFAALEQSGRRALIPYVVAGDPGQEVTVPVMHKLVAAGANIIELGVPFSDPMAEGPVIQLAHERALANNVSLSTVLSMVREFRDQDQATPVLLMGYANPVARMGYSKFADAAQAVGLDALLTVDMPPEEVAALNIELQRAGLDNIFLVAPTTPLPRIEKITERASGFVYYISLKGVTGAGHLDMIEVANKVGEIRARCSLPVVVGFGIKDADSAAAVARIADGVVVGSALVQLMALAAERGENADGIAGAAAALLADMRAGMDAGQTG